ncbi:MAG: hypothetical protein IJV21_00085, partial [Lachnospiraceae bacterium]|nr:hypothetical protein [Lachnospiraceae bacterium]
MKKIHSLLLAGISCAGILLGGCSLSNNDAREAVEYIGDTASEEDSSVDDASLFESEHPPSRMPAQDMPASKRLCIFFIY